MIALAIFFSVTVVQEEVLVHETGDSLIQSHTESYCLISEELDNLLLPMNSGFVDKFDYFGEVCSYDVGLDGNLFECAE